MKTLIPIAIAILFPIAQLLAQVPFTSTSFMPKADLATGIYPHAVVLADFNGDGKADLFVSKGSSSTVAVFPNTSASGAISWGAELDLPGTGTDHEGAAVGDLDGDGKPDIVVTNGISANSVSIYRNTSTGGAISFAAKIDSAAVNGPYAVAIGDLDGDGKPDLAIANNGGNVVSIYLNTSTSGHISFAARVDITVGTNPYSVAIGDLDGDGKADLAVTTQGSSSSLYVLQNTSTTGVVSFGVPVPFASLSGGFVVTIGDLDGDEKPDLAAASAGASAVTVVRNSSTIGTIAFGPQQNFTTATYPVCVSLSDLDGDGKLDMVTSNRYTSNISALRNTSTNGSISFDTHVDYPVDSDPFYVATGDLDGDGRPDIAVANSSSSFVSIFRNIIGANVAPVITSFTPASGMNTTVVKILGQHFTGATAVAFGGTNAASYTVDSATGITAVVGAGSSGNVSVTTGYGTTTLAGFTYTGPTITSFTPTVGIAGTVVTITGTNFTTVNAVSFGGTPAVSFTINSPTSITATVGTGSSGSVSVVTPSNGTATLAGFSYGPPTITAVGPDTGRAGKTTVYITGTNFSSTASSNTVYFGAVKAAVSAASPTQLNVTVPVGATYQPVTVTTNSLTAYSPLPFIVTFNTDTPTISSRSFAPAGNFGTGAYPWDVSFSDLDGDGKPDMLVINGVGNTLSVLKNTGSAGTVAFNPRVDLATGPNPKHIAIGDLDGDGKPDVVVVNFNSGNASTISVFRNTSTGGTISFAPKADFVTGNGSLGIAIADMNGDGLPDILVTSGNSGYFSIFQNTTISAGNISFATRRDFGLIASHGDAITVADLDFDGLPDIITANFGSNSITILRNTSVSGVLSLGPQTSYAVGTNPTMVTTADLDGDGKLDLAVTNYSSGTVSFFKNNSNPGAITLGSRQDMTFNATNLVFTDLNGDAVPDLCAGNWANGKISVFQNISPVSGPFTFAPNVDFLTGNFDAFAGVCDLDGDGKPDLAALNTELNTVTILRNQMACPIITALSAISSVKGGLLTLSGSKFVGVTAVNFGGTPADSFSVVSANQINAVVGGGTSGNITVTNALGTGSIGGFNFVPQISAGGDTIFCKNGSVLLSSTATANNQWYVGTTRINGATGSTYLADTTGLYTVKTTGNGITTTSTVGVHVIETLVPTPVITRNTNGDLLSSNASGNQWYLNGSAIPGAVGPTYHPVQSGNYTVQTTDSSCTSDLSAVYNAVTTEVINLDNNQYINIFPNPVIKELYMNWNINGMPSLTVTIFDFQGKQLQVVQNMQSGMTINLAGYPAGLYFVKIYSDRAFKINRTVKVIKVN